MTISHYTQCPACESMNSHVTKGDFRAWGFQPLGNRICDACGTTWRPRCPRWVAIVSIIPGCVVLAGCFAIGWSELHGPGLPSFDTRSGESGQQVKAFAAFVTALVVGFWACGYRIAVLSGKAGEVKILGKVLPADAGTVCAGCHRPIPAGSAFCPHCGVRQTSPRSE